MPLTQAEMAELESLRSEQSQNRSPGQVSDMDYSTGGAKSGNTNVPSQASSLSKEEEAELMALRQEQDSKPSSGSSLADKAMTQLESFGNTVSFGYLPQIQAAIEKINPNPTAYTDEKLKSEGFIVPEESYVDMRDQNINRQQEQAKRNPLDATLGTVMGMVASTPVITGAAKLAGAGQTAGVVGRVKDSIATGFGLGAISNPGDTQGKVDLFQGQERLSNAGKGGAIGGAGQTVGETVAKTGEVIKRAPEALKEIANNSAFKATGAMLKDFRAAFGRNSADEIGETLLSKGIVQAGDKLDDIAIKTSTAKQETGKIIGETYKKTEEILADAIKKGGVSRPWRLRLKATEIDGAKIARDSRAKMLIGNKNDIANSELSAKANAAIENLKSRGKNISMEDMLEMKSNLDGDINYSRKMQENPAVQQQLKSIRDVINKAVQDRVRVAGGIVKDKNLIETLKTANKEYGHLATAEKTAIDRISRTEANNFFSLGDKIVGSAVTAGDISRSENIEDAAKSILKGFVVATASKYGRSYGPAAISITAKNFGEALKQPANLAKYGEPLIEAAKRSPQEFQALLNQFGKEPEFIKMATPSGR